MFKSALNKIESKRKSQKTFWKIVIKLKDFLWFCHISYKSLSFLHKKHSLLSYDFFEPIFSDFKNKKIGFVVVDGNVGDYLIQDSAEQLFKYFKIDFRKVNSRYAVGTFSEEVCKWADEFVVCGGGNMGTFYATPRKTREKVLSIGKPVTILPQSFFGGREDLPYKVVWVRERSSLEYYESAKLGPDLALGYSFNRRIPRPKEDLGIWLREDSEMIDLPKTFVSCGDPVRVCKTPEEYILLAARYKKIITNRLHFAIAALIARREVILLPNSYHKNRSMYEMWLKKIGCKWRNEIGVRDLLPASPRNFNVDFIADYSKKNTFVSSSDGRHVVSCNDNTIIYDVFACRGNTHIGLIGHYDRIRNPAVTVCEFPDGQIVKSAFIDDTASLEYFEDFKVVILLFPIPISMKYFDSVKVTIRNGNEVFIRATNIDLTSLTVKKFLSLTTLFKDEVRFLKEWLDYYLTLGVDHFYLYDNNSIDKEGVSRVLAPYIQKGIVTHIPWDYPYVYGDQKNSWRYTQRAQMQHCLLKYGHLTNWLLFVDVDEYVFPVDHAEKSILPLLKSYEKHNDVAAISLKCMLFGNSGYAQVPAGRVIANFTRRAKSVIPDGREKYFVRTDYCSRVGIHRVLQNDPGTRIISMDPEHFRLNHYWSIGYQNRIKSDMFNDVEDCGMNKFFNQKS